MYLMQVVHVLTVMNFVQNQLFQNHAEQLLTVHMNASTE